MILFKEADDAGGNVQSMGKVKRIALFMTYVIEFTVCAFIGWLYEEGLELVVNQSFADRGILHLPILPIYGFGGLLLIFILRGREQNPVTVFLVSAAVTTVLELLASYPLDMILGYIPWSYNGWFCNYQGRISLISSVIFGLLGVLLVKAVHPLCRKLEKSNDIPIIVVGCILTGIVVTDSILVIVR
ncbi:Putative ABC-transporter type IV [Ruminococcaceae bacterium YRB3002]|nr:Putative ABC-transporter type IV [Ruminococcaceae bacterium YRB3002]